MNIGAQHETLADRLWKATAPRKLFLTLPDDRTLARLVVLAARARCRRLKIRGYDRTLVVASILAQEAGCGWSYPCKNHVSLTLADAALD